MGFFAGFKKGFGSVFKEIGHGAREVVKFGTGSARQVMQVPGGALAGNLKSLGISSNTLLMIGAGLVVVMMVTSGGGGGITLRR
jgi:hypothetical protein